MQVSRVLLLCCFPLSAAAATYGEIDAAHFQSLPRSTYQLQDFSERYRATLEISDKDDVFRPGIISVYEKKGGPALVQVQSDSLVLDQQPGSDEVSVNVQELPYGEQSVLIQSDFNLDGIPDLALMDGQFSCYGGPSYQVFLGSADGLEHSDAFTELAQNYCGMFSVDEKTREISVFTKSGCCWHEFSTYGLKDGQPVLNERVAISHDDPNGFVTETRTVQRDGKDVVSVKRFWDDEYSPQPLLSFRLAPSGKRIVLFKTVASDTLAYAAIGKEDEVALNFPAADGEQFAYDATGHVLSFSRGDTTWQILGDDKGMPLKMQVQVRGKVTELKLQPGSVQGSLDAAAALIGG